MEMAESGSQAGRGYVVIRLRVKKHRYSEVLPEKLSLKLP
jgi:hypothetical protein